MKEVRLTARVMISSQGGAKGSTSSHQCWSPVTFQRLERTLLGYQPLKIICCNSRSVQIKLVMAGGWQFGSSFWEWLAPALSNTSRRFWFQLSSHLTRTRVWPFAEGGLRFSNAYPNQARRMCAPKMGMYVAPVPNSGSMNFAPG